MYFYIVVLIKTILRTCTYIKKIALICIFRVSNSLNIRQREKQILDKILGRKVYDNRIRPVGGNATSGKTL